MLWGFKTLAQQSIGRPEMSSNWGAKAPTSCHYLVYPMRLFTTHMMAACSGSLSSHSPPSIPSEACHHSHFIENSGQASVGRDAGCCEGVRTQ